MTSELANTASDDELPRTIAGYFGLNADENNPNNLDLAPFVTPVHDHNKHMRDADLQNMFVVCGDPFLDLAAQFLYERVNQTSGLRATESSWRRVMLMLKRGVHNYVRQRPAEKWILFVDTNPSFIIYTQIAVTTCNYLIIPTMPDKSSTVGVKAVCALVYGQNLPNAYQAWAQLSFSGRASQEHVDLPVIKLIPHNRTKPYNSSSQKA